MYWTNAKAGVIIHNIVNIQVYCIMKGAGNIVQCNIYDETQTMLGANV